MTNLDTANHTSASRFSTPSASNASKGMLWTGRVLSALIILFMLFDGITKVIKIQPVVEGTAKLGFPERSILVIGVAALIGAILYTIPRTAVLGAIVLTGFFGGAVATHERVSDPVWMRIFPIVFGIVTWLGIYFRDARVRSLIPLRRLPA